MEVKRYQTEFYNRPLTAEFSNLAEQANGSVIVKYGETVVMATAVMAENQREGIDYFPLTVDYEEKFYAAGRILGSRFIRREGRPSEEAILNSRMVDRTLRPLFDKRIKNDIQVIVTALSIDEDNDPDILAILASSLALAVSDIPWNGPVGALRIGRINNRFVINPTYSQRENSSLDLVVCGREGKINMIEGKAREVPEDVIIEALALSLGEIEKLVQFQEKIVKEIGKDKKMPEIKEIPREMREIFGRHFRGRLNDIFEEPLAKQAQNELLVNLKKEWLELAEKKFPDFVSQASDLFEENIDKVVHFNIVNFEKRPDGRKLDEIREITAAVGVLPRAHGTGLFFRGQTHILSVATLGAPGDVLIIEGMEVREKRRFIHHYNFPPFSSGETGRLGAPSRREIGHGALAEKALSSVIPSKEEFPYTIRVVSETLSSNGSSSMGSVCASSLALMDAGVPIKSPVAGIAMGLMMDSEENYKVLTDIQGPEDHHGDTDFKAAGTEKGITAIQMDVKVKGLTKNMLNDLLIESRRARLKILEKMKEVISEPREKISPYAPHIISFKINPEKIREVIGPSGKTINKIIETTDVEIDIEEDGDIFITGKNEENVERAKKMIEEITYEYQVGEITRGKVSRILDFGAIVELPHNHEGLIHISELAPFRVSKVSNIVKIGEVIPVKIIGIDDLGRINLSLKQADPNYAKRKRG